jgi:hypothetical protein
LLAEYELQIVGVVSKDRLGLIFSEKEMNHANVAGFDRYSDCLNVEAA